MRPSDRRRTGQRGEVDGSLPIAGVTETTDQLDDVPSSAAPGETIPSVGVEVDHESAGVVSAMERTRADEPAPLPFQRREDTFDGQHLLDGDTLLQ
jgi:hypothetical protein